MTELLRYVPVLACVFALLSGLVGLVRPTMVLDFVKLEATNSMGMLEARAMFGGIFIAMAITCLVTSHPYSYLTFAVLWLGGGAAKLLSLSIDRPQIREALPSASLDLIVGLALLCGFCFQ